MPLCDICYQPECPESSGEERPAPASHATKLAPGERDYRGYGDWATHPDEARYLLHRGYALVDGKPQRARFLHNEAFVTMVHVEGTFADRNNFYESK